MAVRRVVVVSRSVSPDGCVEITNHSDGSKSLRFHGQVAQKIRQAATLTGESEKVVIDEMMKLGFDAYENELIQLGGGK